MKKLSLYIILVFLFFMNNSISQEKNETQKFIISGIVIDCENYPIPGATIQNLKSKTIVQADVDGKFSIETKINDSLQISFSQYKLQTLRIENKEDLKIKLTLEYHIMVEKPVIYLYPTTKTQVDLTLNFNGKLLTTFPKYEEKWNVIAEPNGLLFDTKTNRYYNSLYWDGSIELDEKHTHFDDGFIVEKEKLVSFFIEKLEFIGLNNQETNEFIQFWLPLLEKNKYNFIHFLINEKCNDIATLNINPKPETSIRVYMEYLGLDNYTTIQAQKLEKVERNGYTLVEWGGFDLENLVSESEFIKLNNLQKIISFGSGRRKNFEDFEVLYVINNKISTKKMFDKLNPSEIINIKTINSSKGAALYGELGINGAYIIETKKETK